MTDSYAALLATFQKQFAFSKDYSALYASLFFSVAGWLAEDRQSPLSTAIFEASIGRRPLDVTLLFAAALHRDILVGEPALAELAQYYPSAAGTRSPGYARQDDWHIDPGFQQALYRAVLARRQHLHQFIRSNQVQTNETGRGIAWLFPLWLARWPRINLLDLGASAGLNLLADRRHYHFIAAPQYDPPFELGEGQPGQFVVQSASKLPPAHGRVPQIISRTGCDLNPFYLRTPLDEATLAAFVWADQLPRLQRLREGIATLRQVNKTSAPVNLTALELPADLSTFLLSLNSDEKDPLVCYNTYIRMYLPEKGVALRHHLSTWAREQERPVLWIQWEPPSSLDHHYGKAPHYGWLAWTIDLWHRGQEFHWHIAWVHPHGHHVHWLPDLTAWIKKAGSLLP